MTDSRSSLAELERVYPVRNPTISKILNLLAEEGGDLKLMWVHTGIEGNKSADKVAKEALHEELALEIKATENDWFKWTKETAKKKEK
jgi:ribonuclease HI